MALYPHQNSTFGFHICFPLVLSLLSTIWHWRTFHNPTLEFHNLTLNFRNTSCFCKCRSCYTFPAIRHTLVVFYASWFCLFHFFPDTHEWFTFQNGKQYTQVTWTQTNKINILPCWEATQSSTSNVSWLSRPGPFLKFQRINTSVNLADSVW